MRFGAGGVIGGRGWRLGMIYDGEGGMGEVMEGFGGWMGEDGWGQKVRESTWER